MRKSLMVLVTLAGAAAFATTAQAGDVAEESAVAHADGGCGYSQAYLQAQIDEAEKAETRAKLEVLIDRALDSRDTAAAPAATPLAKTGG